MVKMVRLTRTAEERKAEEKAGGGSYESAGEDGVHVHLSNHHLRKLGLHGNIESGRHVHIHAKGKVTHSSSSDDRGKKRKTLTIHLTHGHLVHSDKSEEDRAERKEDL